MKHVAAYLLAQMGGKASPSADDVTAILGSVGAEGDSEKLEKLLAGLEGKDFVELLAAGPGRDMARLFSLLVLLAATCASGFVAAPAGAVAVRSASVAPAAAAVSMTSADKKAKAAKRKIKSSRAAAKRFKVTATGKLLRHYAGKAHLLRKKRPQHLAKLRRVGSVNDAELDTYQKLLLVFPKRG